MEISMGNLLPMAKKQDMEIQGHTIENATLEKLYWWEICTHGTKNVE